MIMAGEKASEERKRQVAEAVISLVAREGLAAASIRRVAAEAGVSAGLVQRYFRTKRELLRFAFSHLHDATMRRLSEVGSRSGDVTNRLVDNLSVLLPLDEWRRAEAAVWLAFLAETQHDPVLARAHEDATRLGRELIAEAVRAAQRTGETEPTVDADSAAALLMAFLDGLVTQLATMPGLCDADWGRRALVAAVEHALRHPVSSPDDAGELA